jgi:hypothetical protein
MAYTSNPENVGEIQEKEFGNWFTYRETKNLWAITNGLFDEIDFIDGNIRFGNVKRTVAYIAVDEDEKGNPILDKWELKKNIIYKK